MAIDKQKERYSLAEFYEAVFPEIMRETNEDLKTLSERIEGKLAVFAAQSIINKDDRR